ncbi:hypothetical protein DUNSADRAFT_13371, partial [Dunaliella salina]
MQASMHLQRGGCREMMIPARIRPQSIRMVNRVACHATKVRQSVTEKMAELKEKGKIAFIPFIAAGDPDLETTEAAVRSLDALGADVIELGVPYS